MDKWKKEELWRAFIEGCITIRVQPSDVIGNVSTKDGYFCSFRVEFTAPQVVNPVIQEIITNKLCEGSVRFKEFKQLDAKERIRMVTEHGMVSDASVKIFDGINLDTLKKVCYKEMKNVIRDELETSFQMTSEESSRKLVLKLQRLRNMEGEFDRGSDESRLDAQKDLKDDKLDAWRLLQELKIDLETYRSACEGELKEHIIGVIHDVADAIEYFSKMEFGSGRIKRMNQLKYLRVIFVCYGVLLLEKK